jgi:hypothetical protein
MSNREPDQPLAELQVVGRGGTRSLRVPTLIVATLTVLAILKPWTVASGTGSGAGSHAPSQPVGATEEPDSTIPATLESALTREIQRMCASPSGWRVSTLQRWPGRAAPIRSWSVVEPIEASEATDPRIPIIPVAADTISALGYCAPTAGPDQVPTDAKAELYRVDATGAHRVAAVRVEPRQETPVGVLWAPSRGANRRQGSTGWPDGVYVIRVANSGGTFERWLGAELRTTPGRSPAA